MSMLACEKVEIKEDGDKNGQHFHKFSCVVGECEHCPKWKDVTNQLKQESDVTIVYNVWSRHGSCPVHKDRAIGKCADGKVGCLLCDSISPKEKDRSKAKFKLKHLRIQKMETMAEFMKEGETYHTHANKMLYHTCLIQILGSRLLVDIF